MVVRPPDVTWLLKIEGTGLGTAFADSENSQWVFFAKEKKKEMVSTQQDQRDQLYSGLNDIFSKDKEIVKADMTFTQEKIFIY